MKHLSNFIIKPIISEKSYDEAKKNRYTFVVARQATKIDVKNAIEKIFKVNVTGVSTINVKGTKVRNTRTGKKILDASYKKARVALAQGQKIEIFEEKTEDKKDKKDKK